MPATGITEAKDARQLEPEALQFAVIKVQNQIPDPRGEVEVPPGSGRIVFQNLDPIEYRVRFFAERFYDGGRDPNTGGIDLLLPANGSLALLIKKDESFNYSIMSMQNLNALTGQGGGPGKN
jgi:hypothetical protein